MNFRNSGNTEWFCLFRSRYKNDCDAVGIFGARKPQLLIVSPELARRVFVTDFKYFHDNDISLLINEKSDFFFANNPFTLTGEKWKTQRADVTPGLTQSRVGCISNSIW